MTDADRDTRTATSLNNVSPMHKRFSATKIPKDLPLRLAVVDAMKSGIIHVERIRTVPHSEQEQNSRLRELKQEAGRFLESSTVADSTNLAQVQRIVTTASLFAEYVNGRCIVRRQKRQYGAAIVGLVLLELKYPIYLVEEIVSKSHRSIIRFINEYGWLEPDTILINDIHRFFISRKSNRSDSPPLVDLRPESMKLEQSDVSFTSVAPVPPVSVAAVMRALRAGMDITFDGTPEHDQMSEALFTLVGLAVRRGAPMLTLGWAVNVHHNTIRKYALRSPVEVYSLGVRDSTAQQLFETKQKELLHKKPPTKITADDEFISVTVHDTRTPAVVVSSSAPTLQEIGMTSRPKVTMLKKNPKGKKKISTAVLGSFKQYSEIGIEQWRRETTNSRAVEALYPDKDADLKSDIGAELLVPRRKNNVDDDTSMCDIEIALISVAGVHARDRDEILSEGEYCRVLLPLNPLSDIAHLVPNNTLDDARRYQKTVKEYLVESAANSEGENVEDPDEAEDLRQILIDNRVDELMRYVPPKYQHLVDPNRFDVNSMIWKALCEPGQLVNLIENGAEAEEFDTRVPSLGVVEEGGRIRPPKKRKGGPYARE